MDHEKGKVKIGGHEESPVLKDFVALWVVFVPQGQAFAYFRFEPMALLLQDKGNKKYAIEESPLY